MLPSGHTCSWLRSSLACGVVVSAIAFDILDPMLALSVVIVAVALRSGEGQSTESFENMPNAENVSDGRTGSGSKGVHPQSDVLRELDMPVPSRLRYFAYPSTPSLEQTERVLDLVDQKSEFRLQRADASAPKWSGPKTSNLLSTTNGHEPRLSVFITLDGKMDANSLHPHDSGRASLFLAYASDPEKGARGEQSEKWIQLSVHAIENGEYELRGQFGDDEIDMPYPLPNGPRTHYLIRDETYLRIGFFDPVNDFNSESSRIQAKAGALLPDEQVSYVNATGRNIGRIYSVVIYDTGMWDHISKIQTSLSKHALLHNPVYRKTHDDLIDLREDIRRKKTTPTFDGVADACSGVEDWTKFNAINASQECRDAIKASCEATPSQDGCRCWDEEYPRFKSSECSGLRILYGSESPKPSVSVEISPEEAGHPTPQSAPRANSSPGSFITPPPWWEHVLRPV